MYIKYCTDAILFSSAGFALVALLSYKNLEVSLNQSFKELTGLAKDGVDPKFKVSSRVVSVVVSNPSTEDLSHHVNITLRHLQVVVFSVVLSSFVIMVLELN